MGVILLHGIVESIFNFDLRKMFSKKKQMLLTLACCLGFVIALQLNVDRFDSYIPEEAEVERIELSVANDRMNFYNVSNKKEENAGVSGEHVSSVLKMVENTIALDNDIDSYNKKETLGRLFVKYHMKNGKVKSRQYNSFDTLSEENRALLDSIMATEEFKKDYYGVYDLDVSNIEKLEYYNGYDSTTIWIDEKETQQLIDIYKKELSALTFTEM